MTKKALLLSIRLRGFPLYLATKKRKKRKHELFFFAVVVVSRIEVHLTPRQLNLQQKGITISLFTHIFIPYKTQRAYKTCYGFAVHISTTKPLFGTVGLSRQSTGELQRISNLGNGVVRMSPSTKMPESIIIKDKNIFASISQILPGTF